MKLSTLIILLLFPFVLLSQITASHRYNQALTGNSNVSCITNPDIAWIFETGDQIKSAPVVTPEHIVIGNTAGSVFCLNHNGDLIWKDTTDNSIEAPALILDNTVFIGNLSGTLNAFNLSTGERKWTYRAENQIMGAPNWFEMKGRKYLLIGSYDYYLHCVDATTGEMLWKYELDNYLNGTVAVSNGKAVFGGCDGFLHVVDLKSGTSLQRFDIATYIAGSPAISNGVAYIGDYDGGMTAVNLITNINQWQYRMEENTQPFVASPATDGNLVFNGSRDKHAYCFDATSGDMIWKVNTGMKIDASPVICTNGVLFINTRGELYLLKQESGEAEMEYNLGVPVFSCPSIIKNAIVIGAADGNVYFLTQN
jgi:outer membrane protein assembly factor BamB